MRSRAERLTRLVRYRDRLERLQEQRLAAANRTHQERERQLGDARASREAALDLPAAADPTESHGLVAYLQRMEREIGARTAAVAHSRETVEAERETLLERSRDRKAMETLLDHERQAEHSERLRQERTVADEVAAQRHQTPGAGGRAGTEGPR